MHNSFAWIQAFQCRELIKLHSGIIQLCVSDETTLEYSLSPQFVSLNCHLYIGYIVPAHSKLNFTLDYIQPNLMNVQSVYKKCKFVDNMHGNIAFVNYINIFSWHQTAVPVVQSNIRQKDFLCPSFVRPPPSRSG